MTERADSMRDPSIPCDHDWTPADGGAVCMRCHKAVSVGYVIDESNDAQGEVARLRGVVDALRDYNADAVERLAALTRVVEAARDAIASRSGIAWEQLRAALAALDGGES